VSTATGTPALPGKSRERAAEAERRRARAADNIRRVRVQMMRPGMLSDPQIAAELDGLYKQVSASRDERRGRHRFTPGAATATARPAAPEPVRDVPGFDLKPNPLAARTSLEYVAALRKYWEWCGRPSYRVMASQARNKVAHSTLWKALNRDDLPDMGVVLAIITGCGGSTADRECFVTAWRQIKAGRPAARLWIVPTSCPQ